MNILHSAPCRRDVDTTTGVPLYQIVVKQLGVMRWRTAKRKEDYRSKW